MPGVVQSAVRSRASRRRRSARARSGDRRRRLTRSRSPRRAPSLREPRQRRASSSTSTPAPSPITNPSRRASNGREIPVGDSACIELKLPNPNGVSVASAPPTTTASASSYWIMRSAAPIAWAPLEHADTMLYIWPCRPYFIETAAAAAFDICAGIPSGDILAGPRSRSTSCWSSIVWIPPIPVARMQPSRIGSYGRSPSQPASAIASPAATSASCENRSSRRISLTVRSSLGSKSVHAPAPSKIPHSPAAQREYSASAPTPSGVTAPSPVITTLRRAGRPFESTSLT